MEQVPGPSGVTQIVAFQLDMPPALARALVVRCAPHFVATVSHTPDHFDVDDAAPLLHDLADENGVRPCPRMMPQLLWAPDSR